MLAPSLRSCRLQNKRNGAFHPLYQSAHIIDLLGQGVFCDHGFDEYIFKERCLQEFFVLFKIGSAACCRRQFYVHGYNIYKVQYLRKMVRQSAVGLKILLQFQFREQFLQKVHLQQRLSPGYTDGVEQFWVCQKSLDRFNNALNIQRLRKIRFEFLALNLFRI